MLTSVNPVALDATLWNEPITGIGLYLRQLHRALVRSGLPVERWGAERSGEYPRKTWSRTMWTLGPLPVALAASKPRLYHALANFNLPLARVQGVPFVLTVHDLVPLILPHTVSRAFRFQFQAWLTRSLLVADQVICVSETAKASLLERFAVPAQKLSVVLHGVDHVTGFEADATTEKWLDAQGLDRPFVLYAGALDARKNVQLVLDAMQRLERPIPLVLAGQKWFGSGAIETEVARLRARGFSIRTLGYLPDPVFYAVMKRANVFVFPSRYEGFGLPPLEAMRLGVPTIISTEGSLPEVCGAAALQVGPDDAEALAHHIGTVASSPSLRAQLGQRGQAHASRFTWQRTAEQTRAVYDAAVRGTPRRG